MSDSQKCCVCGKEISGDEAIPSPDPYASEIAGNETPVIECNDCRFESCQDI